jgi:hypothetical protein
MGCGQSQSTNSPEAKAADSFKETADSVKANEGFDANEKIIGFWTDGSSENATMYIQQDSVFYTDRLASYPYYTDSNYIYIKFEDAVFTARLSWLQDTLVFTDQDSITTKFTRFRK